MLSRTLGVSGITQVHWSPRSPLLVPRTVPVPSWIRQVRPFSSSWIAPGLRERDDYPRRRRGTHAPLSWWCRRPPTGAPTCASDLPARKWRIERANSEANPKTQESERGAPRVALLPPRLRVRGVPVPPSRVPNGSQRADKRESRRCDRLFEQMLRSLSGSRLESDADGYKHAGPCGVTNAKAFN